MARAYIFDTLSADNNFCADKAAYKEQERYFLILFSKNVSLRGGVLFWLVKAADGAVFCKLHKK